MTTTEQTSRLLRFRKARDRRTCSLEVSDITVTTDDNTVLLDGLSFKAEPGSRTCIVGTDRKAEQALLSVLSGESKVASGAIRINGTNLSRMSSEMLADTIDVVPMEPEIVHGTIRENILLGRSGASRYQLQWAVDLTNIESFTRFLPEGMDTVVSDGQGDTPATIVLSAGQRRRIALARMLLRNPSILILEEPTSDLGTREEQAFARILDRVVGGRTMIVLSHRIAMARKADGVLVLNNGRLAPYDEAGTRGTMDDHARLWEPCKPPTSDTSPESKPGAADETDADGTDIAATGSATPESGLRSPSSQSVRLVGSTSRPSSDPWGLSVGAEIAPGYVASGLLARTEHADVWAAWCAERKQPVRIKVPAQSPVTYHGYEQLSREFQMVKDLRHPGVAAAYELDLDAEMPFAVFEYFDSPSLASLMGRLGAGLDPLDVLYIGFELAGAVNYLHQRGRVHLDLRARHIRTRADTIVIGDLGRCRPTGSTIPNALGSGNGHRGEHWAVAPEQQGGATVHPKMDIYALGALMHHAAAGTVRTELTPWGRRLVPFSSLMESAPISLIEIVDRMLSIDPADRPDAEEVLTRFRRVLPPSLHRPRITTIEERCHRQLAVSHN